MVVRSRRTTGRAANFVPPEPLGRIVAAHLGPGGRALGFHPPGHTIPVQPAGVSCGPSASVYHIRSSAGPAVVVAAAAFAATWVCWSKMGTSWRMGIDPNERTQLVFTGPYAYVRHPIYALSSLLMICTMAAVPSPLMMLVGVAASALPPMGSPAGRALSHRPARPALCGLHRPGRPVLSPVILPPCFDVIRSGVSSSSRTH